MLVISTESQAHGGGRERGGAVVIVRERVVKPAHTHHLVVVHTVTSGTLQGADRGDIGRTGVQGPTGKTDAGARF